MYIGYTSAVRLTTYTPNVTGAITSGITGAITGPRSIGAVSTLRLSITDRCNFRCLYCMPEDGVEWLASESVLTSDEIIRVARVAFEFHGIRHFKVTGGEPTLRKDLLELVTRLRGIDPSVELSMTTNGFAMATLAGPLREAGLGRVTISLDSLREDRFAAITRTGKLPVVLAGLSAALSAGFSRVKLNCVVMRGINDDEIADFAKLSLTSPISVRFIEYMPLGDAPLSEDRFVGEEEMMRQITDCVGAIAPITLSTPVARISPARGPAREYAFQHANPLGTLGFISAMSNPFCSTCNRLRLTVQGVLRSCLFEGGEVETRAMLRDGSPDHAIANAMVECVMKKPDVHSQRGYTPMSRIGG